MNDLHRELAPITPEAWKVIDDEARRTLKLSLAGRKLVDFRGPLGWQASAVSTGKVQSVGNAGDGVETRLRQVLPLAELRVPFELARDELDAIPRGGDSPDLGPLVTAARHIAAAEDHAIFLGHPPAHIEGIVPLSPHPTLTLGDDPDVFVKTIVDATERLREAGIAGPYAVALGPRAYTFLARTTGPGGYALLKHVDKLLDGGSVWAPVLEGAVIVTLRGGDFELSVGRDLSIGFLDAGPTHVRLYLEESFTFRLPTPEAAVPLGWPG